MAVYSVSQVSSYLRDLLEQDFLLRDIWVSGEVANLMRSGTGHNYFTLRESNNSLRCVMFRNTSGSERLVDGGAIIAHGRISMYEVRGDVQLIVDLVQPEGVGQFQLELEQLKLKLEKEGLFEPSRKRPLPRFPRRVGVVTSPASAVWHDIQTVVERRYPLAELCLAPTPVQGHEAAPGVVESLAALNELPDVDVIIVARGGGSLENLWPFNQESVAKAIFSSRAPVISAVGHETDYTIADLVADRRAPTPSAAAETVVPDRYELATALVVAEQALNASISGHTSVNRDALKQRVGNLERGLPDLDSHRMRLDDLLKSAGTFLGHGLEVSHARFDGLKRRLESVSPTDTVRRGYAIVERKENGAVVSDVSQVAVGDAVRVTVNRGGFEADVASVESTVDDLHRDGHIDGQEAGARLDGSSLE